jgi:hypothetical protein
MFVLKDMSVGLHGQEGEVWEWRKVIFIAVKDYVES